MNEWMLWAGSLCLLITYFVASFRADFIKKCNNCYHSLVEDRIITQTLKTMHSFLDQWVHPYSETSSLKTKYFDFCTGNLLGGFGSFNHIWFFYFAWVWNSSGNWRNKLRGAIFKSLLKGRQRFYAKWGEKCTSKTATVHSEFKLHSEDKTVKMEVCLIS